jgi:hypothetical protein
MTWLIFPDITLTNGSNTVTVNDGASTGDVVSGFALVVNGAFFEIESKNGTSITLSDNYSGATQANISAKVMQTHAGLASILSAAHDRLSDNSDTFESFKGAAFKDVATLAQAKAGTGNVLPDAAGVLAAIKQFGLGGEGLVTHVANDVTATTFFKMASSDPVNPYSGSAAVTHLQFSETYATQKAQQLEGVGVNERVLENGTWSDWDPVYTRASLNPNVFGGVPFGAIIAAFPRGSTSLRVILPFELIVSTPDLIFGVGEFDVVTTTYGTIKSNIPAADFTYVGRTLKSITIDIKNLTGLLTNVPYYLRGMNSN